MNERGPRMSDRSLPPLAARPHRVAGSLIGSVVGDALGAPFEFGPSGQFSRRFPTAARGVHTEMCGGGSCGWKPGEFTDDTQMALIVAASLLEHDGLDEAAVFEGFHRWVAADPLDVGIQTSAVMRSGLPWQEAAAAYFASGARAAGNGSVMRTTPAAVFFARFGRTATMDAARGLSALTHGDPAAGEGCAIFHELVRVALDGDDPLGVLYGVLDLVAPKERERWARVLAPGWTPDQATEPNGAVWPTLGSAVWALRTTDSFEGAMRAVIDLGGDTDTVAAVTGGLVGAVYGIAGIPERWTSVLNGTVPGHAASEWSLARLHELASALDGGPLKRYVPPVSRGIDPVEVLPGVWASDLDGAQRSDRDLAVISLCRTGEPFGHEVQRFAYLIDDDSNPEAEMVLKDVLEDMAALRADGKEVLVHCFGGASRTGLVLRAWLMRTEGLGADEATERIAAKWPHLGLWNDSFTNLLRGLHTR